MGFFHIVSEGQFPLLHINNIGWSADPANNRFGPGKRDIWLIHYVISGKGIFNGTPVCAGQGFLIRRGQMECYFPDSSDPWEFLWITSDDDGMEYFFNRYAADKKSQIFNYDFIFSVRNVTRFIQANHNRILKNEELLELFLHIYNLHAEDRTQTNSNASAYTDFAVNYIKTNLHAALRVREIAEILGISQTYLVNLFKKRYGISPKQYISELRLQTAKKLITESDMSITEIACSVGFDDVLVFSRFFSSKIGISPTGYRKSCRNNRERL